MCQAITYLVPSDGPVVEIRLDLVTYKLQQDPVDLIAKLNCSRCCRVAILPHIDQPLEQTRFEPSLVQVKFYFDI